MIRRAVPTDLEAIYSLICELEDTALPRMAFGNIYIEQLNNKNYVCLVYEEDGKVTGVLNMRYEYQLHHAERISEITEFIIEEAYRDKGIGRQLYEYACLEAVKCGCAQIEAASNLKRLDAHRFYLRVGMIKSHYKFTKPLKNAHI